MQRLLDLVGWASMLIIAIWMLSALIPPIPAHTSLLPSEPPAAPSYTSDSLH